MKTKLLALLICLSLFSITANAQTTEPSAKPQHKAIYQGEVLAGYGFGLYVDQPFNRIHLSTIHGLRFSDSFYAGLGIGVDFFDRSVVDPSAATFAVPAYLQLKWYLPLNETLNLTLGGDLGVSLGDEIGYLFLTPSVGLNISESINVSLSYTVSSVGFPLADMLLEMDGIDFDAVSVKVAFQF